MLRKNFLRVGNKVQQKYGFKKIGTVVEIRKRKDLSTGVMYRIKLRDKTVQVSDGRSFKFLKQ